jgi:hypothetical protein
MMYTWVLGTSCCRAPGRLVCLRLWAGPDWAYLLQHASPTLRPSEVRVFFRR